ncbi:MAG TPA: AtpZ/AtpI family protein [Vicinamibacterales bacterium]|nr:AtpZ/AtpI family protein [Vicinamibacterales bacterium]
MKRQWNQRLADANTEMQDSLDRDEDQILASYSLLGSILAFVLLGYLVDRWTGEAPTFLVSGAIAGIAVGFYTLVTTVRRTGR